ncbi:MAG TPA: hypothetical protein PKW63_10130 [Vicinamibacterales bacterium]|mgnify:CR=1 FL=1|jgi:hypothetical protein|nr:hypothetical protein [Acidobacteriota bacterium]HQX82105.1 hypothetical protein [Vicinamibacterales bacterium]
MSENETKKDDQQELPEDQLDTVVGGTRGVASVGLNIVAPKSPGRASGFGDTPGLNGGDMMSKISDD